jgi:hypothetical protein
MVKYSPPIFGRRQFLLCTSASLIATTVLGPSIFAADATAPVRRLAVGFTHASEVQHLFDAESIPAGDGVFIRAGARIAVSGSSGTSATAERRVVQLITNFPYFDGAELKSAAFHTWSASRVTGRQGSPLRFVAPMDLTQKLAFDVVLDSDKGSAGAISRRRAVGSPGTPKAGTSLPFVLSVQNDPDAIRLLRGFYVIVPLFDSESAPNWSRYRLFRRDGRWTMVDESGRAAKFEHLVLHVNYAE